MRKQKYVNFQHLILYIYSNGSVFSEQALCNAHFFFKFNKDMFNSELWLNTKKEIIFENKKLLKFKNKFNNK